MLLCKAYLQVKLYQDELGNHEREVAEASGQAKVDGPEPGKDQGQVSYGGLARLKTLLGEEGDDIQAYSMCSGFRSRSSRNHLKQLPKPRPN